MMDERDLKDHLALKRKRGREGEMVAWCHWLNGHESEQTPGDSEGQGSLACCSPWGHKESDMTERLNNNKKPWTLTVNMRPLRFTKELVNWSHQASSGSYSSGILKAPLSHWDDPEEWDGQGGGRRVQDGEHMYTHGRFKSMYGKTNTIL